MLHVEVIQNEWAAGQQRVVARITLNGTGQLQVESPDEERWSPVALKPFVDPVTGSEITSESDPERFLRSLHAHLRGDYLFATEAHEEGECDYPPGQKLPLTSVPAHDSEPQPA